MNSKKKNLATRLEHCIMPTMTAMTILLLSGLSFAAAAEDSVFTRLLGEGKQVFAKAKESSKPEDYQRAAEILEQAAARNPKNAEVHYFLGYAYDRSPGVLTQEAQPTPNVPFAQKVASEMAKAISLSPRYEGEIIALDPYSKLASAWGALANCYMFRGQIDSVQWAFEQGRSQGAYGPAWLEYTRNVMASCEPDAILFANGDMDTFPVWFLQVMERYRTDIVLVNLSLLNNAPYAAQLKRNYPFGHNKLPLTLSDSEIDSLRRLPWTEQTVEVPVKPDSLNPEGVIRWTVKSTLRGSLRVQDQLVLDILRANRGQRPVYFGATVSRANLLGLEEYLPLEGLLFRLNSHKGERIAVQQLHRNCFDVYHYESLSDPLWQLSPDLAKMGQNLRSGFMQLAYFQSTQGQRAEAKRVLDFMNEKLPESKLPYSSPQLKVELDKLYKSVSE